jgi:hypothetical protein
VITAADYPVQLLPRAVYRSARRGGLLKTESRLLLAIADTQRGKHRVMFCGAKALGRRTASDYRNVPRDLRQLARHGWLERAVVGGGSMARRPNGHQPGRASTWAPGPRLLQAIAEVASTARRFWHGNQERRLAPAPTSRIDEWAPLHEVLQQLLPRPPD